MNDISIVTSKVPAHVKNGTRLGNENVTSEHLSVPRVKQLQKMSNEVDKNHSDYMEGAEVGDFINTVTGENYGQELYIVNVHFKEEYVLWVKRDKGGGLVGSFASNSDATDYLEAEGKKVEDHEIIQTQTHTLLRVDEKTGDISDIPFLFDCASSKLRVSREWNTQIAKFGGDRFSSLWKMASISTSNRKGQAFMNIEVSRVDFLKDEAYETVKKFYTVSFGDKLAN